MTDADYPQTMADLFERIQTAREALEERVAELGDAGLNVTTKNGWPLRDHLIHIAAWEASLAGIFRRERRGPAMGLEPSDFEGDWKVDDINALLLERHRSMSDDDVRSWFASAHSEALAMLRTLIDSDLQRPFAEFQPYPGAPGDTPIAEWIAGDTYRHYEEHLEMLSTVVLPPK